MTTSVTGANSSRPDFPAVNILGADALSDPYSYFAPFRAERPVLWDSRYKSWLVTSHELVVKALRDPRFSSDRIVPFIKAKLSGPDTDPVIYQAFQLLTNWMVFQDEPGHRRLRMLVFQAFTVKAVARMEDEVRDISRQLLSRIDLGEEFDLTEKFAYPLPAMVIARMLGVPEEDQDRFREWSDDIGALVSGGLDDAGRYRRSADAMAELIAFFRDLLEHYSAHPSDNLISQLLAAREADDSLSEAEVIATCVLLLFGGHETTANLITNSMLALIRHPDQLAAMRAGVVPIKGAVEEFLRYDGPGKAVVRVLAEDVEYGGELMRKGQRVFLVLAAANHDPAVFDEPDVLRLDRETRAHVAFGTGPHFCLGSQLARLEAAVALPILVEALPRIRLAERELRWHPVFLTRGLRELWVSAA
jgi:cytochrome P450